MAFYHFKRDYSYLDTKTYSSISELYDEIVESVVRRKEKWLIFIDDKEKCVKEKGKLEKLIEDKGSSLAVEGKKTKKKDVKDAEVSSVDVIRDTDALDADQRKVMHERYTMIAPIVSFISGDKMRSKLICSIAEESKVSKQTVRNYLCLYLSYLDMGVLASKKK